MEASTVEADENAVVDTDPLGVISATLEAPVVGQLSPIKRLVLVVVKPLLHCAAVAGDEVW